MFLTFPILWVMKVREDLAISVTFSWFRYGLFLFIYIFISKVVTKKFTGKSEHNFQMSLHILISSPVFRGTEHTQILFIPTDGT